MDLNRCAATEIDAGLVAAYRAADYWVTGAVPPFVLRVDEPSTALAGLHRLHGVSSSALLSACNPASIITSDEVNAAAQRRLVAELSAAGSDWVDALGMDPRGIWPAEPSALALGLNWPAAIEIARDLGQNAFIWAGVDAVPQLVLLR